MRDVEESTPLSTMQTASKTASAAKFPHFRFTYAGKMWRVFRRPGSAAWYIVFQRAGKRHLLSLGATKEAAIAAAKVKIQAWSEDRLDVLRRSMERPGEKQFTRLTEFITAALAAPCGKPSSRADQAAKLRLVVRRAGRDPDTATTGVFGDSTAQDYFRHVETEANRITDQKAKSRFLNSALSTFIGANATITPAKLRHYSGINLPPDLKPFREGLIKSGLKQNKTARNDPSWPMIRGLMREFVALGKRADYAPAPCRFEFSRRNVFLAMGLELCFGLRKNEVRQVRWEWFSQDTYGPVLRGDAMVKNGSGELRLTPLDPFWRIFNRIVDANGWRKTTGLVLEGDSISHTRDYPFAHVGAILRRCGWTTQKTNHALRDLSASLITTKFGAQKAQWWARHSSVTTTEAHYSRFVDQRAALTNENVLPWLRFAKK